jgi:hypothetical protein
MIRPGHVLVFLSEERKRKLFEREGVATDGRIFKLFTQVRAEEGTDSYLEQSVMVGEIIGIARDIKWLNIGDIVILDYLVDMMENETIIRDDMDKTVILPLATTYHLENRIAFASMNSRRDTFTWKKGDVNDNSLIYGVYRDGDLIANPPYIICEHQDFTVQLESASGLIYNHEDSGIVIRKIISVPKGSSFEKGDFVAIERYCLYGRSVEGINFDIIMEQDVLAIVKP